MSKRICFAALLFALLMMPKSLFASVTACTNGTLQDFLNSPCSIGGITFTLGPGLNGIPTYYPGLFAGDSVYGPAATQITFTPVVNSQGIGFTLTGNFGVNGAASTYIPSSGLTYAGNYSEQSLGPVNVDVPLDQALIGDCLSMTGAVVTTDTTYNRVSISGGPASVYMTGSGQSQTSNCGLFGSPLSGHLGVNLNLTQWDYSASTSSVAKFDSFTFLYQFQPIGGSTPEPASLLMMGTGLVAFGRFFKRRITSKA